MADDWLEDYRDQVVVADLAECYVVIGRLVAFSPDHLAFAEADLHDHRDSNSTKEVYCLETARLGVRSNRRAVAIPRRQLVAISRLTEL